MILIEEILISDEVLENKFVCNLNACKGACCVEGDYGAPLEKKELDIIKALLPELKPYLDHASIEAIEENGFYTQNSSNQKYETALMPDGACVLMGRDALGITYCSLEKLFNDGKSEFKKPISCHLYPIRIIKNEQTGFQALNYDRWDICEAACDNGEKLNVRVFEFVKEALIRKFGPDFYDALEDAAKQEF